MMMNFVQEQEESKVKFFKANCSHDDPPSWVICVLIVCETDQKKARADGHPADPPETTRIETEHELDVIAEAVGTWNTQSQTMTYLSLYLL